ncbi:exonuclease V [Ixodes scapularis]
MMDDTDVWDDPEGDDLIAAVQLDSTKCLSVEDQPPLFKYRGGRVYVSDLSSQMYCEQKLLYSLIGVRRLREMGYDIEVGESAQVTAGTNIHLARALEIQDVVSVSTITREDNVAVSLLNLLGAVRALLSGVPVVREVPVFGMSFGGDIFVNGIVDEIRCDAETLQIDVVELKTRASARPPSKCVRETHHLQVMVYGHLLRNLIQGKVKMTDLEKGFRVNRDVKFSSGVLEYMSPSERSLDDLRLLVPVVLETIQALPLPANLIVEYYSQEKNCSLSYEGVNYDEGWLIDRFEKLLPFWKGERPAEGVQDIEEVWKCRMCEFQNFCEWRLEKECQCVERNSQWFRGVVQPP